LGRSTLALCDWEKRFVMGFLDHYMAGGNDYPDIKVFSDVETLKAYVNENYIEVLLIADSFMSDEVSDLDINKIIILSEGSVPRKYAEFPVIYKYQSSERIISEIMNYYADNVKEDVEYLCYKQNMRVIGVYSPVKRIGKTSFALTLGQLLGADKRVLYLNMEEYSGLTGVLGGSYKGDLLDAIFYQRRDSGNLKYKLQGMTCRLNNLDYISPAMFSEELKNVKGSEWIEFIENIRQRMDYDVLILDMGDTVSGLTSLMEKCSVIYMPQKHDFFSQGKIMQFEEYMRNLSKDWVTDKIIKIDLPEIACDLSGKEYLESLLEGPFVNHIKSLCMEEIGCG